MASHAPPVPQPAPPPAPAGPDFSSLERHLLKITSQIEALQRPDHVEQSIAAFRSELAEIRLAITEAMPRRAIESIENEIHSLSRRIEDSRQSGTDSQMLAGIERALGEIYDALRSLKPAEQLTGYDDAIRNLGAKLDMILRSNDDPSTVHQLEGAIAALRSIVSNVASNDALLRLSEDVHALSAKVDQFSRASGNQESLATLEARIVALTSSLEGREQPVVSDNSEMIEGALRNLSERLDRIPVGNDNASAFAHLEQRVSYLLERLENSSSPGAGDLGRVEDGLQDILRQLERQHANLATLADNSRSYNAPQPIDSDIVDAVKRELSDIRFSQSETDRHTQEFAGDRPQHARPCGRSPGDDRRRSTRGSCRAAGRSTRPRTRRSPACGDAAAEFRAAGLCTAGAGASGLRAAAEAGIAKSRCRTGAIYCRARAFCRRAARIPCCGPGANAAGCRTDAASGHQRNPRTAGSPSAHRDCAGATAGPSAGARHTANRTGVVAVRAHCRFRERDQRNFRGPQGAGQFIEFHRRRAPRRAGCRRCRARQREGSKGGCEGGSPRPPPSTRPRPTARSLRTSPPRSARCWLAQVWS